jgi:hypothetical protein
VGRGHKGELGAFAPPSLYVKKGPVSEFGHSSISRIHFCSASGSDIYNILIIHVCIELLSFGNGIYFEFIYLLNTIEVSKATV